MTIRVIRAGEHVHHIGLGISVRESGVAVAAANWWEVPGKTCVAAYQPKGAASYAASKTNLANPGTYDAAEGVAPSWAAATGWSFDGVSGQFLSIGDGAASGPTGKTEWTVLVRCTVSSAADYAYVLSCVNGADQYVKYVQFLPTTLRLWSGHSLYAFGQTYRDANHICGITENAAYLDGEYSGAISGAPITGNIWGIGALVLAWTVITHMTGSIQAISVYDSSLSSDEMSSLSTAMADL